MKQGKDGMFILVFAWVVQETTFVLWKYTLISRFEVRNYF